MNYSELSGVLMEEKRSPSLLVLDSKFLDDVESLLDEYRKKLAEKFDVDSERAFANLKKKFDELQMVRARKVFLQALSDFQLGKTTLEGMTGREIELYSNLSSELKSFMKVQSERSTLKLKMLSKVPKFIGLTGREYGPFDIGSTAEIDERDCEILFSRNVAERV